MDDLFDDFDLKPATTEPKAEENIAKENLTDNTAVENPSDLSSEDMHPDIFDGDENENDGEMTDDGSTVSEAENTPSELSFADEEKVAVEDLHVADNFVEVRTIDKIRRPNIEIDPENYGDTLRRLRESACISLTDLSAELRIKESFLAALEREDYDILPPEVFVIAYIRKLGGVYHLTEDEIVSLTAKVRSRMEIDLPEDMDKVIALYEHSEENDNKLRHILTVFAVVMVIVLLFIGGVVYFFLSDSSSGSSDSRPPAPAREKFSPEMLIDLQPEAKLNTPPLKITK